MGMIEIMGLEILLKNWKKMPDAAPSEYSCWVEHYTRNQPFTAGEISRYRRRLATRYPTAYAEIFDAEPIQARTAKEKLQTVAGFFGDLDACRQQGRCAGDSGCARTDNPYPPGSGEREFWDGGWCDSLDESRLGQHTEWDSSP